MSQYFDWNVVRKLPKNREMPPKKEKSEDEG